MEESVFNFIFKRIGQYECVPSEKNKKKAEGCFNAINDFGKDPTEAACKKCWKQFLEDGEEIKTLKAENQKLNNELANLSEEFEIKETLNYED